MKNIITFLVCLSCFYMIFQPFRIFFDGGQALSMLIPTIVILMCDRLFLNKTILIAALYAVIVLYLRSDGVKYFDSYLSQLVSTFFSICCIEHYLKTKDMFFAKSVLFTYFGSFVVMAAISIPQFYLFPEMTRALLFAEHDGTRVASQFYWSIAYSSMHEIPLLLIPLVVYYKQSQTFKVRLLILASGIILFAALLLGDATTPLLMAVAVIFLSFYYDVKRSIQSNLKRLALVGCGLLLVLNKFTLIFLLTSIQPVFEGSTNSQKIDDTISQLQTGDVEERSNLGQRDLVYSMSENTFLSHPFSVEYDDNKIGQHSFILDHLAVMGLILVIPLVILTLQRYKALSPYYRQYKYYYILCYVCFIAMAYLKNFFLKLDAWFIVPLFLLFLEYKFNNQSYENNTQKN